MLVRDLAPKPGLTKGLLPKFKGPATVVACRPYSAIVAFDGFLDHIRVRYRHLRKFNTPNEPDEPSNEPDDQLPSEPTAAPPAETEVPLGRRRANKMRPDVRNLVEEEEMESD